MQDENFTENLSLTDEETPLPEGWRWVKLQEICRDISDGTHFTPDYISSGVPFLSVKDVKENGISFENCRYISQEQHEALCRRCKPENGDVLYTKVGTTGIAKAIDFEKDFSIFVSVALLKLTDEVLPSYLERALNSPIGREQAENLTQGAANRNLILRDIRTIKIPLPPTIEEQRRIASVLDEQMKAVEQARLAVEQQRTAANLLPSAFLRVVFESEEAQNWQKRKLGEVCNVQLGKMLSPKSKGGLTPLPYLRNANVQWSRLNLNNIATMDFSEKEAKKFELKYGDLLVCEGGEPGRAAIWREEIKPCYYQKALHRLRPLNGSINPEFLMYRLWFSANQGEFVDSNAKTTIAHLPAIRLLELPIEHPPIEEQTKIAERINEQMQAAETLKKSLTEKLAAVKKLPAALLRKAFAGEI